MELGVVREVSVKVALRFIFDDVLREAITVLKLTTFADSFTKKAERSRVTVGVEHVFSCGSTDFSSMVNALLMLVGIL